MSGVTSVSVVQRRDPMSCHTLPRDQEEYVPEPDSPTTLPCLTEHIVVYLFLVCYGRSKSDQIRLVMPSFLQVSITGRARTVRLRRARTAKTGIPSYAHSPSEQCPTYPHRSS